MRLNNKATYYTSFGNFRQLTYRPRIALIKELVIFDKILFVPVVLFSFSVSLRACVRVNPLRLSGFPGPRFGYGSAAPFSASPRDISKIWANLNFSLLR